MVEQPRLVDVAPVACCDPHCAAPAAGRDRLGFLVCAGHLAPPAPFLQPSDVLPRR